jgi:hypothetical protein
VLEDDFMLCPSGFKSLCSADVTAQQFKLITIKIKQTTLLKLKNMAILKSAYAN